MLRCRKIHDQTINIPVRTEQHDGHDRTKIVKTQLEKKEPLHSVFIR